MRDVDLKKFIMTHQHTEAKNHFPYNTRNPNGTLETHGTPLHVLRNPCCRALVKKSLIQPKVLWAKNYVTILTRAAH